MQTALATKSTSGTFTLYWVPADENTQYYMYLYFAELEKLQRKQFRGFNVSHNEKYWKGPIIPDYLHTSISYSIEPIEFPAKQHNISFSKIKNSTLPPTLNALEIYSKIEISELQSDHEDGMLI